MHPDKKLKINVIDLLIVVVLLAACIFFIQFYSRLKNPASSGRWIRVEAATFIFIDSEVGNILKIGDIGYDEYDNPSTRIIKFIQKPMDKIEKLKKWYLGDEQQLGVCVKPIFMEMEIRIDKRGPFYYYETQSFGVGGTLYFKNPKYTFEIIVLKYV